MLTDFPKLECPFVRKTYPIDVEAWKKFGSILQLRSPEVYLVTPEINPDFDWVFTDPDTFAVEKLNGTNIKILVQDGRLVTIQNRQNVIDPLQIAKGKIFIMEGILWAIQVGYIKEDGEFAGEVIGPKLQGNPYELLHHIWFPFDKAIAELRYKLFDNQERSFNNWWTLFQVALKSRFDMKYRKVVWEEANFAEGVVFYNLKRKAQQKSWRAKLRRDMFPWYYAPHISVPEYEHIVT